MCHDDGGFIDQNGYDRLQALFQRGQVSPNDATSGSVKAGDEMKICGDQSVWRVRYSSGNGAYNTTYGLVAPWESKSSGKEDEEEKEGHLIA